MEPPEDTASLRTQISNLQTELDLLRARYDTLLETKNRAAERYKADYKKWRGFKRWLFGDIETDNHIRSILKSGELDMYTRVSALGKRKQFEEFEACLEYAREDDDRIMGPKQEPPEDSRVALVHSHPIAVTPRKQRRKSYHGESSHKVLSPSPRSNRDPFLAPQSTNQSSLDDKNKAPSKPGPSQTISLTEPRKGRGRYAQAQLGNGTINSRFSIRTDRNNGVDFQYDAVVRNREERKRMFASDCECCQEYYEAVGPLPASRQPLWRTPTKRTPSHSPNVSNDKENTDEAEKRKQLISRHRHHWHRPKTPPGYWDIGFPDTQEVSDINRRAAEMHKRKLVEVEAEARNNNGRYTERVTRIP